MQRDQILLVGLMAVVLGGVLLFYWLDVARPRKQRRLDRRERRERRRLQEIRFRFWYKFLRPRKTRLLTDQRAEKKDGGRSDPD